MGLNDNLRNPRITASLDTFISNFEQYGKGRICLDCEAGEPHACPLLSDPAGERRRYQLLRDLEVLNA